MFTGPKRDCGSSLSTTLRRPITSLINIVERSSKDSRASHLLVLLEDAEKELLDNSLLVVGVVAELHKLLQHSVETESKVINVLTWLEGHVLPLLAKCLQRGLAGAIAVDACCSDGVPSLLGSSIVRKRELHLERDCSNKGIQRLSILVVVDVAVLDCLPHVPHLEPHTFISLGESRPPTTRANIPDNSLEPVVTTVPVLGESHATYEGRTLHQPIRHSCHALLQERHRRAHLL